jgi:predicted ATP-grasp superfamily ATP-dependent carboligase
MLDANDGVSVTVLTPAGGASEFVPAALIDGAQQIAECRANQGAISTPALYDQRTVQKNPASVPGA